MKNKKLKKKLKYLFNASNRHEAVLQELNNPYDNIPWSTPFVLSGIKVKESPGLSLTHMDGTSHPKNQANGDKANKTNQPLTVNDLGTPKRSKK